MALPHRIPDNPTQDNFDGLDLRLTLVEKQIAQLPTLYVRAAAESLRVIRGTVNTAGSGNIDAGSGFTITRNGTGDVTLTFTLAFGTRPTVVAISASETTTVDAVPTTTTARVRLFNNAAAVVAQDSTFQFVAIGPA